MELRQREHIHAVMTLAGDGVLLPSSSAPDPIIRESWARCVHEYRLDPTRMQEAVILPHAQLREHQDRIEEFLRIARHGLETLYQQVAGMGYCVLLTDARGVTVDFIGDLQLDHTLRRAGLYLGSDWSEHHAGTCGVGTAITTGQALTVHQEDHFDATHIPLTCTAAPVYDPLGQLTAILDISALVSPQAKSTQHLALQLVKVYANRVENANFLRWFRNDWVLKLHPSPEFIEISPDHLLALDASGRIIGHNRAAQRLLETELTGLNAPGTKAADVCKDVERSNVLGVPFERLFNARFDDLPRFMRAIPGDRRAVTLARSGRVLFLHAVPPPVRWATAEATVASVEPGLPSPLAALSGGDAALDRQIRRAARLVNSPVSILITGETGTGKEYFAQALHAASARRDKPFVAVNCAAIPETLIESELFGHLPGSFTGASTRGKRGLIAEADGGTLFLDEIGDMPLALQPRLLRVLAERELAPVGATRTVHVDIRVIAATHVDLETRVREGRFRDDLYYRLNGAHVALPALRQRSDLGWLIRKMLRESVEHDASAAPELSLQVAEWLRAYPWPGNLRELHNALAYASAVCSDGVIELTDLPDALHAGARFEEMHATLPAEARLLVQYLRAAQWNVTAVARKLGVARMTLYRRMKRWRIESPNRHGS
jgi:transcriptional regulator of acetoin/glycerol metabolism